MGKKFSRRKLLGVITVAVIPVLFEFRKMDICVVFQLFTGLLFPLVNNNKNLCGSVGKDFGYHACGHEFES